MLSALIPSAGRKPAVPLAGQLAHESCVRPGPLVLGTALLKSPTPTEDRDRHICYRRHSDLECQWARSFLSGSACRHAGRTISSPPCPMVFGIWSLRIPGQKARPFLLIFRTARIVTDLVGSVPADTRTFQHIAEFIDSAVNSLSRACNSPHYCGHRLYLHPISRGRRVMGSIVCLAAMIPSLR